MKTCDEKGMEVAVDKQKALHFLLARFVLSYFVHHALPNLVSSSFHSPEPNQGNAGSKNDNQNKIERKRGEECCYFREKTRSCEERVLLLCLS